MADVADDVADAPEPEIAKMAMWRCGDWLRWGAAGKLPPTSALGSTLDKIVSTGALTHDPRMTDLPDLFLGFDRLDIEGEGATIHVRKGGAGPPLLLVHGYPQTHVMWHRVAHGLADRFTCVVADLRGYGRSSIPASDADHLVYSKRAMARDLVRVMAHLGHERFFIAGHDRGGRVAYRMAFDEPNAVERIAVLDILPTWKYWDRLNRKESLRIYHWMFLAQPAPLPERLISAAAEYYCDYTLAAWTAAKDLSAFDPTALEHYRAQMREPARVHALCEDYRAGAGPDFDFDAADRAADRKIQAPLMTLWGGAGVAQGTQLPVDVWREWAVTVTGLQIDSGHFVPEEAPEQTLAALISFFEAT